MRLTYPLATEFQRHFLTDGAHAPDMPLELVATASPKDLSPVPHGNRGLSDKKSLLCYITRVEFGAICGQ